MSVHSTGTNIISHACNESGFLYSRDKKKYINGKLPMSRICPQCGNLNSDEVKFCTACGNSLVSLSDQSGLPVYINRHGPAATGQSTGSQTQNAKSHCRGSNCNNRDHCCACFPSGIRYLQDISFRCSGSHVPGNPDTGSYSHYPG